MSASLPHAGTGGLSAHYMATSELCRVVAAAELDDGWWADSDSAEDSRELAIAGLAARLHGSPGG